MKSLAESLQRKSLQLEKVFVLMRNRRTGSLGHTRKACSFRANGTITSRVKPTTPKKKVSFYYTKHWLIPNNEKSRLVELEYIYGDR